MMLLAKGNSMDSDGACIWPGLGTGMTLTSAILFLAIEKGDFCDDQ